jgi:2,3-dihydroxybenzoate decarboxylase
VTTYAPFPELKAAPWGWHVETGEHMLRLILSGLFDEVPDLRIIVGHMGELFVWWAWRTDRRLELGRFREPGGGGHGKNHESVTHYLRRNFWVTTSGWFETPGFQHTLAVVGADRVLYSVDYPFEPFRDANDWFESLELDEVDKRKIGYGNAAALLGIGEPDLDERSFARRSVHIPSGAW